MSEGNAESAAAERQPDPTAWGQRIDDERKRELDALFVRQRAWAEQPEATRGKSAFKDMPLTGADVFWLTIRALAGSDADEVVLTNAAERLQSDNFDVRRELSLTALHLEDANLSEAHLERATFVGAHLEDADLRGAHLEDANLSEVHLEDAALGKAHLERATLSEAHLERASLGWAHLERAGLGGAHLEGASLSGAYLEHASLSTARLAGATFVGAHLEGANLSRAHLEGKTYLVDDADWLRVRAVIADFLATLPPADLREAFLDSATTVRDAILCLPGATDTPRVADARWGGVNLAVLDWTPFTERGALLGDEWLAHIWQPEPYQEWMSLKGASRRYRAVGRAKHTADRAKHTAEQQRARLDTWAAATRANRQVATALRGQGMSDEADHFAFRAQVCQHRLIRRGDRGLLSSFLNLLAGYGYKPERTLVAYGVVLAVFTGLYLIASYGWLTFGLPPSAVHTLQWYEALVLSVSSFHGRGFFQPLQNPGDPIAILAAIEAVCGLIIEISFIATFTQRFFGAK